MFTVEDYNIFRPSVNAEIAQKGTYVETIVDGKKQGLFNYKGVSSQPCLKIKDGGYQTRQLIFVDAIIEGAKQLDNYRIVDIATTGISVGPGGAEQEQFRSESDATFGTRNNSKFINCFKFPWIYGESSTINLKIGASFEINGWSVFCWVKFEWSWKNGIKILDSFEGTSPAPLPEKKYKLEIVDNGKKYIFMEI